MKYWLTLISNAKTYSTPLDSNFKLSKDQCLTTKQELDAHDQ